MKKTIALLGVSALIFTGCQKDDTPTPNYVLQTVTFEDVPDQFLASDPHGDNLYTYPYTEYDGPRFVSYTDPATGLIFGCPYDNGDGWGRFMMGGAVISRWNDIETIGEYNQCSVYYSDSRTGKGGHGGSQTFSLVYAPIGMGPNYPTYLEFDNDAERVIDHLYVANSTWGALAMKEGSGPARALDDEHQDWLKLTFQGYDAAGGAVGVPVEYYLADFRTAGAPGIAEGWHRVDLSPLGEVNRVVFTMSGSDTGDWGLNTPAYFCLDDIAVRK